MAEMTLANFFVASDQGSRQGDAQQIRGSRERPVTIKAEEAAPDHLSDAA
jgi:hypothetical protein